MQRSQYAPRPQVFRQPNTSWKVRPQQEAKALGTLNPVGMVNTKEFPWCSPCNEAHSENESPRRTKEEGSCSVDQMNFIDTIFSLQYNEYVHITLEKLEEVKKRGARKGQLRVLNQLDENTKNLRKKEILTYARRNRVLVPPPPAPVPPPQAKEDLPQQIKEVPPSSPP